MDSCKRVAGSNSDFEVDLHLQSNARLAVYKIRLADSFLSTDQGRYLYWVDARWARFNWALLPRARAGWPRERVVTGVSSPTWSSVYVRVVVFRFALRGSPNFRAFSAGPSQNGVARCRSQQVAVQAFDFSRLTVLFR